MELSPELQAVADAIQAFVASDPEDAGALVTQAVVLYEVYKVDLDDGEPTRRLAYTIPTDNFSLSGAIGLVEAGRYMLVRDGLGESDPE